MSVFTSAPPLDLERLHGGKSGDVSLPNSEYTLYDEKTRVSPRSRTSSDGSRHSPASPPRGPAPPKRDLISRIRKALSSHSVKPKVVPLPRQVDPVAMHSTSKPDLSNQPPEDLLEGYNINVDKIRLAEYPDLNGRAYLDNAGTQLPAKSFVNAFAQDLVSNIYGNPHTHSLPARNSASRVAAVRKRTLEFFHADPNEYELVFVANASAAIKLVGESIRDYVESHNEDLDLEEQPKKFWYGFHKDAHNSLIGVREFTKGNARCFKSDTDVETWIGDLEDETDSPVDLASQDTISLFAYPGQSNMTGRRLPLRWLQDIKYKSPSTFTLLDAAALATTKQLQIDAWKPDFTAVSFYKIFGFPDLGGLIVRKAAAHVLSRRKFFAGGTVDSVTVFDSNPSSVRRATLHEQLEEGTLPFHSIVALDHALDAHARLFTSMDTVSAHVTGLTRHCFTQMRALHHPATGRPLCEIYSADSVGSASTHGGTLAFNIYAADGAKVAFRDVEQAADRAAVYVRSGAMCNPGGMVTHLGWSTEDLRAAIDTGMRCGGQVEVFDDKWTGVVRVSFGANSTRADVDMFIRFLREEYKLGPEGESRTDSKC